MSKLASDGQKLGYDVVEASFKIINTRGLHARASAKFVKLVEKYDAEVEVAKDGFVVSGSSIMGLLMLAAAYDSVITVSARGSQAAEVICALQDLVNSRFLEAD